VTRRLLIALGALALAAVVVIGLLQAGGKDDGGGAKAAVPSPTVARRALQRAPAPLRTVYARGDVLLPGGGRALDAQLAALKGYPVALNGWASWCGPCRAEFAFFQRQAVVQGRRVGFLGVNVSDARGDARAFLRRFPLPYPSYADPDERVARRFRVGGLPFTVFYDRRGEVAFVHQGGYATEAKLAQDIRRYALGG
jgi:cytochrome c biogenesis protein CcmG, thiol:disulfide interchange protein DsbE